MNKLIKIVILVIVVLFPLYFLTRDVTPDLIPQNEVFISVNKWKIEQGQKPLQEDERLCDYAERRMNQINESGFSHDLFYQEAESFKNQYSFLKVGENLYQGLAKTGDSITKMWLNSPSHKENIDYPYDLSCMRCDDNSCVQIFAAY